MIRKFVSPTKYLEIYFLLPCVFVCPSPAASVEKTNNAVISFVSPSISWESNSRSELLFDRFLQEAVDSDSIVFDRLTSPSSRLSWARRQDLRGYNSIEQFNAVGQKMFVNIAEDSLRTAAIAALPLDLWEDRWEGWLAGLLHGTVGNPAEEHIQMTSISYSAVRSSWERVSERGGIQWGVRPWQTTPYIYFLAHAGRLAGSPLFTFEGRGGYSMFGATRVEGRVTLQLPASFQLAGGAAIDPLRMASHQSGGNHFGVTLERVLRSGNFIPDSVFFIGFRSGRNDALFDHRIDNRVLAGFSKHW